MTSIYKLIGILTVYVNFNCATFGAVLTKQENGLDSLPTPEESTDYYLIVSRKDCDDKCLEIMTENFTQVVDTDSDDEYPERLNACYTSTQARREMITVTWAKNNRRETVLRSEPPGIIERPPVILTAPVRHPPLTPINSVIRPLSQINRDSNNRLREAQQNCLLPVRFVYSAVLKTDVIATLFPKQQNCRDIIHT